MSPMRALTYFYMSCMSSAAGFSAVASWYDSGVRLSNADVAVSTGVVVPSGAVPSGAVSAPSRRVARAVLQGALAPARDDFRFGTGSVTPVPLGGTGLEAQSIKTTAVVNARDGFCFGTGSVTPAPLGGTGRVVARSVETATAVNPRDDFRFGTGSVQLYGGQPVWSSYGYGMAPVVKATVATASAAKAASFAPAAEVDEAYAVEARAAMEKAQDVGQAAEEAAEEAAAALSQAVKKAHEASIAALKAQPPS